VIWGRRWRASSEGLVDSNASPVLFWQPGKASEMLLATSSVGSQADAMAAVSTEYEKWVKRAMGWVRRKGTRVWGLERDEVRPDLGIDLNPRDFGTKGPAPHSGTQPVGDPDGYSV